MIKKIAQISAVLVLGFIVFPGAKLAHASCSYNYSPESLSAFAHIDNNYLPVQNPPSIFQLVDFSLSTNCYPDSPQSTWVRSTKYISTNVIPSTNIQLNYVSGPNSNGIGTSGDTEKFFGLGDFYSMLSSVGSTTEQANEDEIISSIDKNGGYTMNFLAASNDNPSKTKFASTFVPATNCVALGGINGTKGGPKTVVFTRDSSSKFTMLDLMNHAYNIIGNGFGSVEPYKTYISQFSFYLDLGYKQSSCEATLTKSNPNSLGVPDIMVTFEDKSDNGGPAYSPSLGGGEVVYNLYNGYHAGSNLADFITKTMNASSVPLTKDQVEAIIIMHESGHAFAGLMDEYIYPTSPLAFNPNPGPVYLYLHDYDIRTISGGSSRILNTENCSSNPTWDFRSPTDSHVYGSVVDNGCTYLSKNPPPGGKQNIPYYRASVRSIMKSGDVLSGNDPIFVPEFNVVSCGYIIAAIKGEALSQQNAASHWPQCLSMARLGAVVSDEVTSTGSGPSASAINFLGSRNFSITGSNFSYLNNSVKLTPAPSSDAGDQSALLATPHSFFSPISDFFGGIWSFFTHIIPNAHGQTSTTSTTTNSYIISSVSANTSGTVITFTVPTSVPNGIYAVSVKSANSDWLDTTLKMTISGTTATSTGTGTTTVATTTVGTTTSPTGGTGTTTVATSTGITNTGVIFVLNDSYYGGTLNISNGTTVPAKRLYICPASWSSVANATSPTCWGMSLSTINPGTLGGSGSMSFTITIPGSGGALPTGALTIPAAPILNCPTVPTSISGVFVRNGSVCTFSTTATSTPGTFVSYYCPTGAKLSTTIAGMCTPAPQACTAVLQTSSCSNPAPFLATFTYSCPTGYSLSGSTCNLGAGTTTTPIYTVTPTPTASDPNQVTITAGITYTCPTYFALVGTTCTSSLNGSIQAATPNYFCGAGYTLSGTSCISNPGITFCNGSPNYPKTQTVGVNGCVINQCYSPTVINYNSTTRTYSCVVPSTLVATSTGVTTPPVNTATTIPATASYACSTGTLSGTNCIITKSATTVYTCPTGATLSGTYCITTDTVGVAAISKYVVPGFISNKPAYYTYSCLSGYTLKTSNNRCYKNPTTSPATATQSCPAGYTTQGSSCTSTYTPNPTYSCPTGYVLNSTTNTCSRTVSMNNEASSTANVWDAIVSWFGGLFK